ncbi:hypothetical protein Sjap_012227 [Stephania japonica]|uniref:Uncharacterized protein n=1 Tax=Stephania japonica TaxID=461633 RepID=A0AAP0IWS6_9MAGN
MADEGDPYNLSNMLAHKREMRRRMEARMTQKENVMQMLQVLQAHIAQYNQDRAAPAVQVMIKADLDN